MSEPASISEPILDPDDLQNLEAEGTLRFIPGQRARLIHKRRLNSSSEEEYASVPLPASPASGGRPTPPLQEDYADSPPSVYNPGASSNVSDEGFVRVPEFLFSHEALVYAGFTNDAADLIWQRWVDWPTVEPGREIDGGPVTFESMATGHVRSIHMDPFESDDSEWIEAMNAYGIAERTQQAIMTPAYKSLRLTESCQFWVLDTIKARFEGLREIQATSRERSQAAAREARRGPYWAPSSSRHQVQTSQRRISPASLALALPWISSEPAHSPEVRANTPRTITLWKGAFQSRIKPCIGPNNLISEFGPMVSSPGGDFNSAIGAFYFALEYEVAEHYAGYAKKRSPNAEVVILKLLVPNAAIESLISPQKLRVFYPSEQYQKLVWTCRRKGRMRRELRIFSQATLIIGHICRQPNRMVTDMDSYRDIVSNTLLRTSSGDIAVQYTFIGDRGGDFLEDNGARCTAHSMIWHHAGDVERALASMEF